MNLKELPLTKRRIRDDLSSYLFLHYYSQIYPGASKRLGTLLKSGLKENSLSYPVQAELIQTLTRRRVRIEKTFKPEPTASIAHGYTAQILRLMCSGPLTKKRILAIEKNLDLLNQIGHRKDDCIFWVSHFTQGGRPEMAIGLTMHRGLGGVVAVLSLCHKLGVKRKLAMELLTGAINQILFIDRVTRTGLPVHWGNSKLPPYFQHSLYAGDPAMGYALVLAGMRCKNDDWVKEGKRIFKRGIRRSSEESLVTDPTFGSGASGLSHLASKMHDLTKEIYLLEQKKRWMMIADHLYENDFKKFEAGIDLVKTTRERIKLKKAPEATPACIHNSSLGLFLVKWVQEGLIDDRWDAMYGLSNPFSGGIL